MTIRDKITHALGELERQGVRWALVAELLPLLGAHSRDQVETALAGMWRDTLVERKQTQRGWAYRLSGASRPRRRALVTLLVGEETDGLVRAKRVTVDGHAVERWLRTLERLRGLARNADVSEEIGEIMAHIQKTAERFVRDRR